MHGVLIVIIGDHRIVRLATQSELHELSGIPYFSSLYDDIGEGWYPYGKVGRLDELVFRQEMERDFEVCAHLERPSSLVVVEQWHLGNLALAGARAASIVREYEANIQSLFDKVGHVVVVPWFVSADPRKTPESVLPISQAYLQNLSHLVKLRALRMETIDGETSPAMIRKRVSYLVAKASGSMD